jgi:anthranilate synthase component 1
MTTPDLNDYTIIARQGLMTPVYRVALADWETPVSAFYKTAAHEPYAFLLESVTGGEQIARYSYIGFAPTLILRTKGRTARVWERESGWRAFEIPPPQTPLDIARELLHRYPYQASPALPRFTGGLVGYLSYDLVRFFERLPDAPPDDLHTDDCCLIAPKCC